jgi:hypothetical protein
MVVPDLRGSRGIDGTGNGNFVFSDLQEGLVEVTPGGTSSRGSRRPPNAGSTMTFSGRPTRRFSFWPRTPVRWAG